MSKRDRAPIWTRPAPGARRPRLSREDIARAALEIADRDGFEAVSMRRIAAALGTGTMTLYYYVRTKADLFTLMDDALMAQVVFADGEMPRGWRAALAEIARRTYRVFVRHPWALHALPGAHMGPHIIRHIEQSLAAVADAPIDVWDKLRMLGIVDDYVFGHVLRVGDARAMPPDRKVLRTISDYVTEQMQRDRYPYLEAVFAGHDPLEVFERVARAMTDDARFELGLGALIDGLERWIEGPARRAAAQAGRGASPSRPAPPERQAAAPRAAAPRAASPRAASPGRLPSPPRPAATSRTSQERRLARAERLRSSRRRPARPRR